MESQANERIKSDIKNEQDYYYGYQRASAYDPNMCSAAQYSPPYTNHNENYENIILVPCNNSNSSENLSNDQTANNKRPFVNYQRQHFTQNCSQTYVSEQHTTFHSFPNDSGRNEATYITNSTTNVRQTNENTEAQLILHRSPNGHLYQDFYIHIGNDVNNYQQPYSNNNIVQEIQSQDYNYTTKMNTDSVLIDGHLTDSNFSHIEPSMINNTPQENYLTDSYQSLQNHQQNVLLHKDQQRILLESTMSPLLAAVSNITQKDAELQSYFDQNFEKDGGMNLLADSIENHKTAGKTFFVKQGNDFVDLNYANLSENPKNVAEILSQGSVEDDEYLLVSDKPVEVRARASLPTKYLCFGRTANEFKELTIYAKKSIPTKTKFGPIEGELKYTTDVFIDVLKIEEFRIYPILLIGNNGILETENENSSNWMRYVRLANKYSEQNLLIYEENGKLYFKCSKIIKPKDELRVGYSKEYAIYHNLKILEPTDVEIQNLYEQDNPWECFECNQKFSISDDLQSHFNVHDASDEISKENKKKRKVKRKNKNVKILTDIRKNSIRCLYCFKVFMTNISLKKHMAMHTNRNRTEKSFRKYKGENSVKFFKCSFCLKHFHTEDKLMVHQLTHAKIDIKFYKCPQCNRQCSTPAAISAHIKSHTNRSYSCIYCSELFRHVLDLKKHVTSHAVDGIHICVICNKKYQEYHLLRKHTRLFHQTAKFSCNECGSLFPNMSFLKRHKIKHSDNFDFLCAQCGKQFKRKDKLRDHIKRIHSETKKIYGKIRSEKNLFKIKSNSPILENEKLLISNSEINHSTEKYTNFQFKCDDCMLGFKRRGMLVNHMVKRHPDINLETVPQLNIPILKPQTLFYCQYCTKVYKSNAKRKAHILKNHPGYELPPSAKNNHELKKNNTQIIGSLKSEPQSCQFCYKQYVSRNRLLYHQRKVHPNMNNDNIQESRLYAYNKQKIYQPPSSPENKLLKLSSAALELSSIEDRKFFDFLNERSENLLQDRNSIESQGPQANIQFEDNGNSFPKVDINFKVVDEEFPGSSSAGELNRLPQLFEESMTCI